MILLYILKGDFKLAFDFVNEGSGLGPCFVDVNQRNSNEIHVFGKKLVPSYYYCCTR